MKIFRNIIKKDYTIIALFIGSGIAISLLSSFGVDFLKRILDDMTTGSLTVSTVFVYGLLTVAVCLISYADNIPYSKLENSIYLDLKQLALKKMSVIDFLYYQKLGIGRLIQQIENGAAAGRSIMFGFYFRLLRELLPDIIISLVFIALIDTRIMGFIIAGYFVVFIVTNIVLKYLYELKTHILVNEELLNKHLVRGFMELVVFRTNKRFAHEIQKTRVASAEITASKTKMQMTHEFFFSLFALLVSVLKIAVIIYGLLANAITVGETVALMTFLDKAYNPIAIFNVLYVKYKLDRVALERYVEILDYPNDNALNEGEEIPIDRGEITFEKVCFSYDSHCILRDISFTVAPNTSIAFVGGSGEGKSTVVKQMIGLLKPDSGRILIDGYDMSRMKLNFLYDYISYTAQDSPVFDGTLRENIVFGLETAEKDILYALEQVGLGEFYRKLPNGLATEVGEKGVLLSGGERQRLAIARIFFTKAKIIILDEATSAMDNITEGLVMQNVFKAFDNCTLIIIAHRLSAIQSARHIFVLQNGGIAEQGSFDALMEASGCFKALWDAAGRGKTSQSY